MVTMATIPKLLQPVSWLIHACRGYYNQICGCNNLKSNGCFNQEIWLLPRVVSTKLAFIWEDKSYWIRNRWVAVQMLLVPA